MLKKKRNRKINSFTLSEKAEKMLEELKENYGISKSELVEKAIIRLYKQVKKQEAKKSASK